MTRDEPGVHEGAERPDVQAAGDGADLTHFGFAQVATADKARRVGAVFDSVASRYDLMNDLMSLGVHRLWKRALAHLVALRSGQRVLDLAGGSGDMARLFARDVGDAGEVVLADINAAMLGQGRERILNAGLVPPVRVVQANAESLPFAARYFDLVCIAFGLRNVTDKARALAEMHRVLRPGGQLVVLEFSHLRARALAPLYDAYSFKALPWIGQRVAGDGDSYRYLAESIRMHPPQEVLAAMLADAGFERCAVHNLSGGVVAIHRGWRL